MNNELTPMAQIDQERQLYLKDLSRLLRIILRRRRMSASALMRALDISHPTMTRILNDQHMKLSFAVQGKVEDYIKANLPAEMAEELRELQR